MLKDKINLIFALIIPLKLDIKSYIESGILEQYAMGGLAEAENAQVEMHLQKYASLREELSAIEMALAHLAEDHCIKPPEQAKPLLMETIANLVREKNMDLQDLPLINSYSDYKNWLKVISKLGPLSVGPDGRHITVLTNTERLTQLLIVSTTDIPEETHEAEHESFLILEGECRCTVAGQVRLMSAGDFMQIPLHEPHDVQLSTPRVTAILQLIR